MSGLWHDVRFGARLLRRNPVLSTVAILTFALGVGANSAVFSVVNAALLRPPPYADPDRLLVVWETDAAAPDRELPAAPADFLDFRDAGGEVFAEITGYHPWNHTLTGRGEPTPFTTGVVDHAFFRTLGAEPALGRTFRADEITAEGTPVVVLSDLLWRERFGADPGALGATVALDGQPYTVVGVMPPGFEFPNDARLWRPIHLSPETARRDFQYLRVLARLRPGRSPEAAAEALSAIAARLEQAYPETNRGRGVTVVGLTEQLVGDLRPALLVLWGAVGLVLLIACANLASLLVARAAARSEELAVRSALGAGRRRLARQFLGESLVLAAIGGVLGLGVAAGGARLLVGFNPVPIPGTEEGLLDARVVLFTLGVTLAAGLLFGVLPALRPASDLASPLREAGRSSGSRLPWLRGGLIVVEIALATVLTVGAGLLIQTFVRLRGVDPGFDPSGVLAVQVALPPTVYAEQHQTAGFLDELTRRVCALPGVSSCGAALSLPLANGMTVDNRFTIEGRAAEPGHEMTAFMRAATPGYFASLRIPVLAGRGFDERDVAGAPGVVLINQALAERYWPGRDPIGERVVMGAQLGGLGAVDEVPREVIGVIADVKHAQLDGDSPAAIYFPMAQGTWRHLQVVARTAAGDPMALASAVRAEVWAIDDLLPVTNVRTVESLVSGAVAQPRFSMLLMTVFAGIAVLLAAVGIYGLVSYTVSRRAHEVGVRLALGARRGDVLRMVLSQGALLAAIGLVVGLGAAAATTRLLASLLFGVGTGDLATFAAVAAVLAAVALLASYLPASRAARIDPVTTLRTP